LGISRRKIIHTSTYCSTLFRFDPSLGAHEADPADCAYGDMD
jgi:hypothetical protein